MFGVAILYSGGLWFLLIVEISPSGWGLTIGFSRFPGYGNLRQCSGTWSWISSLWSAMECPVVSFERGYVLTVTLGSLYVDTQGYVPALLENLHGMSCS